MANSHTDTQRIHRHNYQDKFTIMPNHVVEHPLLSWVAKSLLWYMLSRPADWTVYRAQLAKVYTGNKRGNGEYAVDAAFEELMEHGFIVYTAKDETTGRFIHRYDVYPEPQEIQKSAPKRVKPGMGKTRNGLDHPQQSNDSSTSTEEDNNAKPEASQKKTQPQAAKGAQARVVVFSCLDELTLPRSLKEKLSREHSEDDLIEAVKRVKAWKTRKCDKKAINAVLAQKQTWDDTDRDPTEDNRAWAKSELSELDFAAVTLKYGYQLRIFREAVELSCGMNCSTYRYDSPNFKLKLIEHLEKLGYNVDKQ